MPKGIRRKPLTPQESEEYRQQWNIPNWRHEEEYLKIDLSSRNSIIWQFLRRDHDYRAAWGSEKKGISDIFSFNLREWHDPKNLVAPEFDTTCYLVDFDQTNAMNQWFHYQALRSSRGLGDFIFSVDAYAPLAPQIAFIEEICERFKKSHINPNIRHDRPGRKQNKSGRSLPLLLRILDACNEGVSVSDLAEVFGGEDGISEAAIRKTEAFARSYWRRFFYDT